MNIKKIIKHVHTCRTLCTVLLYEISTMSVNFICMHGGSQLCHFLCRLMVLSFFEGLVIIGGLDIIMN